MNQYSYYSKSSHLERQQVMVKFFPMRVFISKAMPIVRRLLALAAIFLLILAGLGGSKPMPPQTISQKVQVFTQGVEFDFISWTLAALRLKLLEFSLGASKYMVPQERKQLVLSYLELVRQIKGLEVDERLIYSDPNVTDPQAEAAPTHRELEALYEERAQIAPWQRPFWKPGQRCQRPGVNISGQAIPPVHHSTLLCCWCQPATSFAGKAFPASTELTVNNRFTWKSDR
jgi:hypothetical protein